MKYLMILLVTLLVLVGCGNKGKDDAHTMPKDSEKPKIEEQDESTTQELAEFKEIDVKIENDEVKMTGKANVSNDNLYYSVQQEDKEVYKEKKVVLDGSSTWVSFSVNISIKEVPDQTGVIVIELYGKDKQGERINPNYIPVDLVQMK